ncbi:acetylcholinesterase-like [Amblyomma americanum]
MFSLRGPSRYLAAYGDVVVVVPNYRLGALGFLSDGSNEAPGNAGLHDQLLAIEWTRDNIANFGGNASNLVLVGYGAGAAAAGYLLFSKAAGVYEARVVPRRAILISGSPLTRYPDNTRLISGRVREQADRMHCVKDDRPDHTCLRAADYSLFAKTALPPVFFPSFTGLIPFPPRELMRKQETRVSGVEVLLGLMKDERAVATEFARMVITEEERFSNITAAAPDIFDALDLNYTIFKAAEEKYKKNGSGWETAQAFYELLADFLVTCPVRELHHRLASDSGNRISRFLVSSTSAHTEQGAMLRLVFGQPLGQPVKMKTMHFASQSLIRVLAYFARNGDAFVMDERQQGQYVITVAGASDRNHEGFGDRQEHCDLFKGIDI